jgi:16S rRNA (adenine1518-N6/adenine1519-N6)-dimethyltransferase
LDIADPGALRALLQRHGLWARKGLGQHFLISKKVVETIVEAASFCRSALEIGPGPGVLTGPLSERLERVVALEVDDRMPAVLAESAPAAEVRLENALEADLGAILRELPAPRAVVSNLPYYITAPLLTQIAGARRDFERAVLMMQREVAERIVAAPGDRNRGSLSIFLQSQFEIRKLIAVPPGAFLPPPKVESSVLLFEPTSDLEAEVAADEEEAFFKFVQGGFVQPRKTLVNNLLQSGHPRTWAEEQLSRAGLDVRTRPQALTLAHWGALFRGLR